MTVADQTDELAGVLGPYADGPATLVGHSWGAWLSLLTAGKFPELVGKVVLVSSGPFREADAASIMGFRGRPLLWHCFGGGTDLLETVVGRGFFVSVPGPVTYAKNTAVAEAVARLELSRLLLETDAPYMTPVPMRGKRNDSSLIAFTARRIAEIRAEEPQVLIDRARENTIRLFGIPG